MTTDLTPAEWLFAFANLGIASGYLFITLAVAPHFTVRLARTRYGGMLFFLTCGLTHLEFAWHTFDGAGIPFAELTSWHMMVIHVVQVVAVWLFVTGLYIETRRPPSDTPRPE